MTNRREFVKSLSSLVVRSLGNVRNVFVENCDMDSPNLDRAFRFKSNARRGGAVENIFVRKIDIGRVAEAVLTIDFLYETGAVSVSPGRA